MNNINIPFGTKTENFPEIPGLKLRALRDTADFLVAFEVHTASVEADQIEEQLTLESFTSQTRDTTSGNPAPDMILAEIDGKAVGYGRCWWYKQVNGDIIYSSHIEIKPEWRSKGIGGVIGQFLESRLQVISRQHPPNAPRFHQMTAYTTRRWLVDLIEQLGLQSVRSTVWMARPCSLPIELSPLPAGLEIRPPRTGELRKVWDCKSEGFKDNFGAVPPTEEAYQKWVTDPKFQPQLWKIAWDGDQPVGNIWNYILHNQNQNYNRLRAYTEAISVRKPWRRKGVARALLTRSIQMFRDMGMGETYLRVDTQNSSQALNFYKEMGYAEDNRFDIFRKQFN